MSGTSLDGIDVACITLEYTTKWTFQIHNAETIPYTDSWLLQLSNLVNFNVDELKKIDKDYTLYLAHVINDFIGKHQLDDIDAICSHGHTALHQPEKGMTYQIGNLPLISQLTKHLVVCDFRTQDVKLGGQGAPLVPIGDQLLFPEYDYCINLGGFANISSEINFIRIAYDICPVNIVLNRYANALGFDFDNGGMIAKSGRVHPKLLDALNALDFYDKTPPKSLGLEWVEQFVFPVLEDANLSVKDTLRTSVEHIAMQIAKCIKASSKVLITGGGAYNSFLIERLKDQKEFQLMTPSHDIINFKEALIFALLGVLKLRNEINCLSSVTGANCDHSSGAIYYP